MSDHAKDNARAWLNEIVKNTETLKALEEPGADECGQCEGTGEIEGGLGGDGEDEECPVCDGSGERPIPEDETADAIRERMQEEPLSIQIRDGWRNPGEKGEPDEYTILLSTGGPALRIWGELTEHCEPDSDPRLQWQDWGTPWTDFRLTSEERDALASYARLFYYGE